MCVLLTLRNSFFNYGSLLEELKLSYDNMYCSDIQKLGLHPNWSIHQGRIFDRSTNKKAIVK